MSAYGPGPRPSARRRRGSRRTARRPCARTGSALDRAPGSWPAPPECPPGLAGPAADPTRRGSGGRRWRRSRPVGRHSSGVSSSCDGARTPGDILLISDTDPPIVTAASPDGTFPQVTAALTPRYTPAFCDQDPTLAAKARGWAGGGQAGLRQGGQAGLRQDGQARLRRGGQAGCGRMVGCLPMWPCYGASTWRGHNKVAMAELRELVGSLGHADVATYIQSGNVVFTQRTSADTAALAAALEQAIATSLGVPCRRRGAVARGAGPGGARQPVRRRAEPQGRARGVPERRPGPAMSPNAWRPPSRSPASRAAATPPRSSGARSFCTPRTATAAATWPLALVKLGAEEDRHGDRHGAQLGHGHQAAHDVPGLRLAGRPNRAGRFVPRKSRQLR